MCNQNKRSIAYDCQYYLGDRPCKWHKQKSVICKCEHYIPVKGNLVIIKLDAMGDVLRTTSLLPIIAEEWKGTRISWITRDESVPLLENNPYITEIIPYSSDALIHLTSRLFDYVINLDAGKVSAEMATVANSKNKIGYIMNEDGYVIGTNEAAVEWLGMGVFDDLKKINKRSYQEVMCSILRLSPNGLKYILELTEDEKKEGQNHLLRLGIDLNKRIIGIHTGGGGRWRLKQWNEEKFIKLIPELMHEVGENAQILLFGGPLERKLNKRIREKAGKFVFDAGCDNEVRHFAALVSYCSVVLSGDSLAMHVALATGCRTVVLFGPTSSAEIELFGLGEKVIPDLDCLCCYKKECDFTPNCMDSISVEMVKQAIAKQLSLI